MFVLISDNRVEKYPYSLRELSLDNPRTSFPNTVGASQLIEWGVFDVAQVPRPTYDPLTHAIREVNPVLVDGAWTQQWEICPLSAEEIEAKRIAAVPASVSPRQIRQALTRAGLRVSVETAVAAGDQDLKDWWEFATEFQRNNQHVVDMGAALGVSELQLDDLFTLAGSL
jgi:hypothetical protein